MSELLILEEDQSYSDGVCCLGGISWHITRYFNEGGSWRRDRSACSVVLTTAQIDRIHAHVHAGDAPRYTEAEWREFQI